MSITRVAVAIVQHENHVLVGKRSKPSSLPGYDEFPGGKCESQESTRVCAVRETLEETGLIVVPVELLLIVPHSYDHGDVEISFWLCKPAEPNPPQPRPPFRWVSMDTTLLERLNLPPANASVVRQLTAKQNEESTDGEVKSREDDQ